MFNSTCSSLGILRSYRAALLSFLRIYKHLAPTELVQFT